MAPRKLRFIPVLGALGILTSLSLSCGPLPIIGDWLARQYSSTYGNRRISYTLPFVYSYGGGGFASYGLVLEVLNDLRARWSSYYIYSYPGLPPQQYTYSIDGEMDKQGRNKYLLLIPDLFAFEITCTVDGDELTCAGTDEVRETGTEVLFVRDEG